MSNFAKSILFVMFFTPISTVFGMGKSDDFFSLGKLSLQKASEVVTEKFVSGTCDFDDIFQIIPVDLHKDFIEAIGKYSISCLRKIFFTCPVSKRYHLECGDELHFSVLSQNSKLLLQLMLSGQGNCCLGVVRKVDEKLFAKFEWTIDEQRLKFLSDSAFEPNSIWDTIPVSFLVCILKIAREN
jgi:hypothetical protein